MIQLSKNDEEVILELEVKPNKANKAKRAKKNKNKIVDEIVDKLAI